MTDERRIQIEQTVADLEARGIAWTNQLVYGTVGGQYGELAEYLKERRASTSGTIASTSGTIASTSETPAAVAVLEPPAPVADPDRAARLTRHLAKWRAPRTAPPPPPTPPFRMDPPSIHAKGPDPIILGSTTPDTRPRLVRALAEVQRCQTLVEHASSQARPLEVEIKALQARQTQLITDRKTVATVEQLRCIKAELIAIEEELEILTRDYAPLAQLVRSVSGSLRQASDAYGMVRAQAADALDKARTQHFHGGSERDKQTRFRELTALVGPEDLERYVLKLTDESQCRYRNNNPPWKAQHGLI